MIAVYIVIGLVAGLAIGWLAAGYCAQRWLVLPSIYGKLKKIKLTPKT